jgi:hypothetical protein
MFFEIYRLQFSSLKSDHKTRVFDLSSIKKRTAQTLSARESYEILGFDAIS